MVKLEDITDPDNPILLNGGVVLYNDNVDIVVRNNQRPRPYPDVIQDVSVRAIAYPFVNGSISPALIDVLFRMLFFYMLFQNATLRRNNYEMQLPVSYITHLQYSHEASLLNVALLFRLQFQLNFVEDEDDEELLRLLQILEDLNAEAENSNVRPFNLATENENRLERIARVIEITTAMADKLDEMRCIITAQIMDNPVRLQYEDGTISNEAFELAAILHCEGAGDRRENPCNRRLYVGTIPASDIRGEIDNYLISLEVMAKLRQPFRANAVMNFAINAIPNALIFAFEACLSMIQNIEKSWGDNPGAIIPLLVLNTVISTMYIGIEVCEAVGNIGKFFTTKSNSQQPEELNVNEVVLMN